MASAPRNRKDRRDHVQIDCQLRLRVRFQVAAISQSGAGGADAIERSVKPDETTVAPSGSKCLVREGHVLANEVGDTAANGEQAEVG